MQDILDAVTAANKLDASGDLSNALMAHMHSVELMLEQAKWATGSQRRMLLARAHDYLLRAEKIKRELSLHRVPSERFHHVKGCEEAKARLREALLFPQWFPAAFGRLKRWQTVLLYGPPGTGKTQLALAAAGEAGVPVAQVSAADLMSKWQGESEKNVRELFRAPREHKQSVVIFVDEVDALCSQRGDGESDSSRRVKTEFLTQMNELAPNLTLIAATNLPWELDSAFLRRFAVKVYVGLPGEQTRFAILEDFLHGVEHELAADDVKALAKLTEGLSGSDLRTMVNDAMMAPLRGARVGAAGVIVQRCEDCPRGEGGCLSCGSTAISAATELKSLPRVRMTDFTVPPATVGSVERYEGFGV